MLRKRDVALWVASGLSVLASGLNPNGFEIFRTLLNYQSSYLTSRLLEWARPALWPPSAFSVLLAAAAAVMLWARRRVRIADWLIFAAFAAAALTAQRNIILAGLVAPIMIAAYLPWNWKWKLKWDRRSPFVVCLLLAFGIGLGVARGAFFQFRAADWKLPKGAADFLSLHHVTGADVQHLRIRRLPALAPMARSSARSSTAGRSASPSFRTTPASSTTTTPPTACRPATIC